MKKIIISVIAIIAIFLSGNFTFCQVSTNFNKLELTDKIVNKDTKLSLNNDLNQVNRNANYTSEDKEKSPFLGAVMSLIIPGTGEFYAKSYVKSAIFFAAEAGLWTVYAIFQSKGNKKTDEYQAYANGNWDIRKYAQWLKDQSFQSSSGINPLEPNVEVLRGQINVCEEVNFSHTLPPWGEQQYYEVIGKYQNFIYGWSTAAPDITKNNYDRYVLPQVESYMTDRQKANDYFSISSYSIDAVVLNHLLSAADAAWSVTVFNKNINVSTSVKFRNVYSITQSKYALTPFLNLQANF